MDVKTELEAKPWRFAKTMPDNPHFYSLKDDWQNPADFTEAVHYIREQGIPEMFEGREYTVLYHNGFKYWTMGDPLEDTYLINRAEVKKLD